MQPRPHFLTNAVEKKKASKCVWFQSSILTWPQTPRDHGKIHMIGIGDVWKAHWWCRRISLHPPPRSVKLFIIQVVEWLEKRRSPLSLSPPTQTLTFDTNGAMQRKGKGHLSVLRHSLIMPGKSYVNVVIVNAQNKYRGMVKHVLWTHSNGNRQQASMRVHATQALTSIDKSSWQCRRFVAFCLSNCFRPTDGLQEYVSYGEGRW